jgi:hypothetical protein
MRAAAKEATGEAKADSRARAEARIRELRESIPDGGENRDKYWAPAPPDGWDYQWKRRTVYNQEDPAYAVNLARTGWTSVPASRHPTMMPVGWKGETIERDGMVLMERPAIVTDRFREGDLRRAKAQVRHKEEQLGAAPQGQFPRDAHPNVRPKIGKSYESIPIPANT